MLETKDSIHTYWLHHDVILPDHPGCDQITSLWWKGNFCLTDHAEIDASELFLSEDFIQNAGVTVWRWLHYADFLPDNLTTFLSSTENLL